MTKFLRAVALLLLAATAVHSLARERVRVAVFNSPPLITYNAYERHAGGLFMDVLHAAASSEGWDLQYVPGSPAQALERLKSGDVDVVPGVPNVAASQDQLSFSRESLVASWGRIYVKPASAIEAIRDLAGRKVAVLKGSVLQQNLVRATAAGGAPAILTEFDDFGAAFRAVAEGRADAVLCNRFTGAVQARETGLRATPIVLAPYGFRYAARRGAGMEPVLDALDRTLLLLKTDADSVYYRGMQRLEDEVRESVVPAWVYWGAGAALFFVAIAFGWALMVRHAAACISRRELELRKTHEELRRITDNSLSLIAVFDAEFTVRRVNRASRRLLGYRPDDVIGMSALDWVPPERRDTWRQVLEQVRSGGQLEGYSSQVRRADGADAPVLWSFVWSEEGQELYAIGHDDTERHDLIASLRRRTEQLQVTNGDLQTFVRSVSHDMRAPVAAVVGFVGKVLRDDGAELPARSRELLGRAQAAALRMDAVIADLLRLARVTEAGLQPRPCDVTAMCHDVVTTLRNGEPGRHVTVQIEAGMRAVADRDLLRHVFDNLLANAWKFTSRNPRACISVGCQPGPGGTVFFVKDDGAGFDMLFARDLFRPFSRLHAQTEFSGNGIGLSIVHRVITAHGGRVWAEGRPGAGAVFSFTLGEPRDPPDEVASPPAASAPARVPSMPRGHDGGFATGGAVPA